MDIVALIFGTRHEYSDSVVYSHSYLMFAIYAIIALSFAFSMLLCVYNYAKVNSRQYHESVINGWVGSKSTIVRWYYLIIDKPFLSISMHSVVFGMVYLYADIMIYFSNAIHQSVPIAISAVIISVAAVQTVRSNNLKRMKVESKLVGE